MAKSFDCPTCGAPISEIREDAKTITCPYCDTVFENPLSAVDGAAGGDNNVQGVQVNNVTNVNVIQQSAVVAGAPVVANVRVTAANRTSPKSSKVAQLLCNILGLFGAHRFYVGKIGTGVLWLLTGGCLLVGWIVDAVSIASGTFTDKEGRPLVNPNLSIGAGNDRQRVCSSCGEKATGSQVRCPKCGATLRSWWETTWGSLAIIAVIVIISLIISAVSGGSDGATASSVVSSVSSS